MDIQQLGELIEEDEVTLPFTASIKRLLTEPANDVLNSIHPMICLFHGNKWRKKKSKNELCSNGKIYRGGDRFLQANVFMSMMLLSWWYEVG